MSLRTLFLLQTALAIVVGLVVTKSVAMLILLVVFVVAVGIRVVSSQRWHRMPWYSRTFSFPCDCGTVIRATAGQAGAEKGCVGCGKSFRVPALSLLISDSVVSSKLVRRSAASRFCLGALLFWVTVVSLLFGLSLMHREQMRRYHELDRLSSAVRECPGIEFSAQRG